MNEDLKVRYGDLNFVESLREQTRAAGGIIMEHDGCVLMRGSHPHPLHNNAVRLDPSAPAAQFVERARRFYGEVGYGFVVAIMNRHESKDLDRSCRNAGLSSLVAPPAMFVDERLPTKQPPDGGTVRLIDASGLADFISVSRRAWATYGIPAEAVSAIFEHSEIVGAAHIRAVVGYRAGKPQAAAMALLSHGVAGVYWVGTVPEARGAGLGEACTRTVTNMAFDAGARLVTLQASAMGEPIYRRMGYVALGAYRLFVGPGRRSSN